MSEKLIEVTPIKGCIFPEGTKLWRFTCDLCGKSKDVRRSYYNYGLGDPGLAEPCEAGFKSCIYGTYNQRKIILCPDHKDAEIEATCNKLR